MLDKIIFKKKIVLDYAQIRLLERGPLQRDLTSKFLNRTLFIRLCTFPLLDI